jgi:hypothetical protein
MASAVLTKAPSAFPLTAEKSSIACVLKVLGCVAGFNPEDAEFSLFGALSS